MVDFFGAKRSIIDIWPGPKYPSGNGYQQIVMNLKLIWFYNDLWKDNFGKCLNLSPQFIQIIWSRMNTHESYQSQKYCFLQSLLLFIKMPKTQTSPWARYCKNWVLGHSGVWERAATSHFSLQ